MLAVSIHPIRSNCSDAVAGLEGIRTHPVSYRQAQRDGRLAMRIRRLSCLRDAILDMMTP